MKKQYVVLDWYEDIYDPYYVGEFETVDEAEEACDDFEAETDSECDCVIYNRFNEKDEKLLNKLGF